MSISKYLHNRFITGLWNIIRRNSEKHLGQPYDLGAFLLFERIV